MAREEEREKREATTCPHERPIELAKWEELPIRVGGSLSRAGKWVPCRSYIVTI